MKIYKDEGLRNFEFWSDAADNAKYLTDDEIDTIESMLEDISPDGMSETDVNDFFRFEIDTIAQLLEYNDFDEIISRNDKLDF